MDLRRFSFFTTLLAVSLSAQTTPTFTRESILPVWGKHPQSLLPNDLIAIYGRHLASTGGCPEPPKANAPNYPTQICGTQVTVAGMPAGLLAVLENQINLQIPAGAPTSGEAPIVVTVQSVASQPVMLPFGKPKVFLSVEAPAYVHMPIWVSLQRPSPYETAYPYSLNLANFGGGTFEVRRNGILLKPLDNKPGIRQMNGDFGGLLGGSIAPQSSPRGRLPLHLQYRFDTPGRYEIRFVGTSFQFQNGPAVRTVQIDESDWTELNVLPYSDAARQDWVRRQIQNMPTSPGLLVGDAIPALLAMPNELALPAILPLLYHSDELVRRYAAAGLTMFDSAPLAKQLTNIVSEKGPTEEIARILDGQEDLFEGGHAAFLATLPRFLNAASTPLVQSGALQYLVWCPNHPWGKTPEFQNQLATMVLKVAPMIVEQGEAQVQHTLAPALGSIKSDASRELLWRMVENGTAAEQSQIALTWLGDSRDLPRLAALLTRADPADPYGYKSASLPYSLHRAYGDSSLPYLSRAARDTGQIWVRTSCAKELALANHPEGFQLLLQAIAETPSFKAEALQFMRDRYPEIHDASEEVILALLKGKAQP